MNAFNTVNLAAAVIMTSVEHAQELGISKDRWIYALGGAGTRDSNDCKNYLLSFVSKSEVNSSFHSLGATKLSFIACYLKIT